MIRILRGIITFILCLLNAVVVIVIVTPLGLLRFIPITFIQKNILKLNAPRPDNTIKVKIWGGVFIFKNSTLDLVTKILPI